MSDRKRSGQFNLGKNVVVRERPGQSKALHATFSRTMRQIDVKLDAANRHADKLLADIKAMNSK